MRVSLINARQLRASQKIPIDATWYMPNNPRSAYKEYLNSHIPNARFFDIDKISDVTSPYPHMLPSPALFSQHMSRLGIRKSDDLCIYDSIGLFSAPRVAWTFCVFGHAGSVSILEGGLKRYDGPLSSGGDVHGTSEYGDCSVDTSMVSNYDQLSGQIVDARPAGRFSGAQPEPRAGLKSGHIPDSLSLPFQELVRDDTLLPTAELRQKFLDAGLDLSKPITTSCGSGVTAAILWLALQQLNVPAKLYDESWTGYASREESIIAVS